MIVETAIVTANWRKNWPVMPLMNAQGTNTAHSTRATAMIGPGHFVHRLAGGLARRKPVLQPALDVLHHHDGVVDHDADRQHQAEQRDVVQAEAEGGHDGERADDGDTGTAISGRIMARQFCKKTSTTIADQHHGFEQRREPRRRPIRG